MVGIGKLTLRQKEHLVAVRPVGDALVLELMRFEHELVEPEELRFPNAEQQNVRPQELAMAEQLIGNLAEPLRSVEVPRRVRGEAAGAAQGQAEGEEAPRR